MFPDWLLTNETYSPAPDRDHFIDKSLWSFLGLLSRLRRHAGAPSQAQRINPGMRLVSTFLFILLLSLSRDFLFVAFAGALLLAVLSFASGELILRVLKTSLPVAVFTLIVMLPSALWGNAPGVVMITLKVFFSVLAIRLFFLTAEWQSLLCSLQAFMPRLFVLVLDITTRYLVLLSGLSVSLLEALRLRSVGRDGGKQSSLAGIAGTLFLRSSQLAEETYSAMECRCFTGSYPRARRGRISAADLVPLALDAVMVGVFLWVRTR